MIIVQNLDYLNFSGKLKCSLYLKLSAIYFGSLLTVTFYLGLKSCWHFEIISCSQIIFIICLWFLDKLFKKSVKRQVYFVTFLSVLQLIFLICYILNLKPMFNLKYRLFLNFNLGQLLFRLFLEFLDNVQNIIFRLCTWETI